MTTRYSPPLLDWKPSGGPCPMAGQEAARFTTQFTLMVRLHIPREPQTLLRNASGEPLLSVAPIRETPLAIRERRRFRSDLAITFLWQTTALEERVRPDYYTHPENYVWHVTPNHPHHQTGRIILEGPLDLIDPGETNVVIVRFDGIRLGLFVDGVLLDEEFPQGPTINLALPLARPEETGIEQVMLWEQPLSEKAIVRSCGGAEAVAARDRRIHPVDASARQYWRPPGWNAFVGDCMPFFDRGLLRLFYLYDRHHHQSRWGTGEHEFAQMTTRDLRSWEDLPDALRHTEPAESGFGTGNCIFHDGIYYLYWIAHARRLPFKEARFHADNIFVATGTDGVHFEKQPEPWLRLDYGQSGDINSFVFRDPGNGKFYQVLGGAGVMDGTVKQQVFESADLKRWEPSDDLRSLGKLGVCPSYLEWRGWHYLFGASFYYYSAEPPSADRLRLHPTVLSRDLVAPMLVNFRDDRALFVGFRWQGHYGGRLVIRELVQFGDGTLGLKWPEEMIPPSDEPVSLSDHLRRGTLETDRCRLDSAASRSVRFENLPPAYHARFRVEPERNLQSWGIRIRGDEAGDTGFDVRFLPGDHRMELRNAPDAPPHGNTTPPPLDLREEWTGLEQPHTIELLVFDDFMDLCIDGRYTRCATVPEAPDTLEFLAQDGAVQLAEIEIRPLADR